MHVSVCLSMYVCSRVLEPAMHAVVVHFSRWIRAATLIPGQRADRNVNNCCCGYDVNGDVSRKNMTRPEQTLRLRGRQQSLASPAADPGSRQI